MFLPESRRRIISPQLACPFLARSSWLINVCSPVTPISAQGAKPEEVGSLQVLKSSGSVSMGQHLELHMYQVGKFLGWVTARERAYSPAICCQLLPAAQALRSCALGCNHVCARHCRRASSLAAGILAAPSAPRPSSGRVSMHAISTRLVSVTHIPSSIVFLNVTRL